MGKKMVSTSKRKTMPISISEEEKPYCVPENWIWVHWGSVGQLIAGSGFPNSYQGFGEYEIPFYKVGNLKQADTHGYLYKCENTINDIMRTQIKATLIPDHSIVFAKIGEAIRLNRRSINSVPCCIDNNMMAFVPQKCDMRYAYYWSLGIDLYQFTNATTVPAIRKSDLEVIPFPLPPLSEQQRIVDRIESLFAKLDEAKEKAQAVVDGFEDRKAAILHKAFTGELTEKWRKSNHIVVEWKKKSIGEIAFVTKLAGFEYTNSIAPNLSESGIPLFKGKNVQQGELVLEFESYIPAEVSDELSRSKLNRKCLLTPYVGTIGNIAIFDGSFEAHLGSNVGKIEVNSETSEEYLLFYLRSDIGYSELTKEKKATAQESISIQAIRNVLVPIPSESEQNEIVRHLTAFFTKEKEACSLAEQVISQIDTMKKAILARAFRGELGTNNPTEPPVDIGISSPCQEGTDHVPE